MDPSAIETAVMAGKLLAVDNLDETVYHSMKNFVSHSMLRGIKESPAKFRWEMDNPSPPSPAQALGSAIHMALLEPDKFQVKYAVYPKVDRRTKAGKASHDEWKKANEDKLHLSENDMLVVERIHAKTFDDDFFQKFLRKGRKEVSLFAKDPTTGLLRRARLDNWIEELGVVVDIKTTDSAQEHVFLSDITRYQYYTQAAYYTDMVELVTGSRPKAFVLLAVEKTKDCDIRAFSVSPQALVEGSKIYRSWLSTLAECIASDKWPGYKREFITYHLPKWLVEENNL
jgi:exodeoxyribonuclease VIII